MKEICTSNINNTFINDIRAIINTARSNAMRSVDFQRVQMYWHLGKRIFEEEQQGKQRADYGTYLIKNLAKQLEPEYGSGFSVRQLEMCRQFYRIYPIARGAFAIELDTISDAYPNTRPRQARVLRTRSG